MSKRVTMVVDNGVRGDSRVIKSARSAFDAGYEVVVIGHGQREDFDIDGPEVRLYPGTPATPSDSVPRWVKRRIIEAAALNPAQVKAHQRRTRIQDRPGVLKRGALRLSVAARWRLNRYARPVAGQSKEVVRLSQRFPGVAGKLELWDHLDPWLANIVRDMADRIVDSEPDLIHAHDYRVLPAAVAAAERLRATGRDVAVIYDAHEYIPGLVELGEPRRRAAMAIEKRFIGQVDGVVTVSEDLSRRISQENRLPRPATVVCNAPEWPGAEPGGPSLRERIGVSPDVPLLVYSGSVGGSRLLRDAVSVLPELPGVHLALIVSHPNSNVMLDLRAHAEQLGVSEFLHLTRYVAPESVVPFLREVDVGLVPIKHTDNVQDSLPTKTLEYLAAGVPQVTSDLRALAEFVRRTGVGEVFPADQPDSMVGAIRRVLASPDRYRERITPELVRENTWGPQAERLLSLYESVRSGASPAARRRRATPTVSQRHDVAVLSDGSASGLVLRLRSRSLEVAHVVVGKASMFPDSAVRIVSPSDMAEPGGCDALMRELGARHHNVIIDESWTRASGRTSHQVQASDVGLLEAMGSWVVQSMLEEPEEPTRDELELTRWLGLPTWVGTPGWLHLFPDAMWIADLVDMKAPATTRRILSSPAPLVLEMAGHGVGDRGLAQLHDSGRIELVTTRHGPPSLLEALIGKADILVLGPDDSPLGRMALAAMNAGALVVAAATPACADLPVVSSEGRSVGEAVRRVLADPDRARVTAEKGPRTVQGWRESHSLDRAVAKLRHGAREMA